MNRKTYILISGLIMAATLHAQQVPLSENYFMDKYSLAPSYAGNYNQKYLVSGYRSDWSGLEGGPKTLRISYNDILPFMEKAGYGGKIVYDKAGIFSQLYVLGSYSYNLQVKNDHHVMFGLSMGLYKNRLNLLDYYNDPGYTIDPSLVSEDIDSRVKFMSDFSAVWTWKGAEAGFLFSNISFGDASYSEVKLKYNPLANYQFHATYLYNINESWDLAPLIILRGGQYVKSQFELASQVIYLKRFRGSLAFRDPGILGFGIGLDIDKGLKLAYNFNYATNVELGALNSHEISLGINIFEYVSKRTVPVLREGE
jgi:type IX secretion system PorP/SprF family membrane protein